MGCDIHILIQILDPVTMKWLLVKRDGPATEGNAGPNMVTVADENIPVLVRPRDDDPRHDEIYEEFSERLAPFWFGVGRCYLLFAKIANVRNYYGLLDVREPRGVPTDLTEPVRSIFEGNGGHSSTWLLDDEIDDLNMEECPVYKSTYFVHVDDYESLKKANPTMPPTSREVTSYLRISDIKTFCASAGSDPLTQTLFGLMGRSFNGRNGYFYTVEQWEQFDEKRKTRERSRPLPYGAKHNDVYIEVSHEKPSDPQSLDEFKQLLIDVKSAFPLRQIRFLINFDS